MCPIWFAEQKQEKKNETKNPRMMNVIWIECEWIMDVMIQIAGPKRTYTHTQLHSWNIFSGLNYFFSFFSPSLHKDDMVQFARNHKYDKSLTFYRRKWFLKLNQICFFYWKPAYMSHTTKKNKEAIACKLCASFGISSLMM